MKPRSARIARKTRETEIRLALDLDGRGRAKVATGIGFFDHMLEALAKHQVVRLRVSIDGITQATYQRYRVGEI